MHFAACEMLVITSSSYIILLFSIAACQSQVMVSWEQKGGVDWEGEVGILRLLQKKLSFVGLSKKGGFTGRRASEREMNTQVKEGQAFGKSRLLGSQDLRNACLDEAVSALGSGLLLSQGDLAPEIILKNRQSNPHLEFHLVGSSTL